jgi:hypothetical protein
MRQYRRPDATDLVSTDFFHLVRAIRRLKELHGLTELGVMILLDKLVSDGLYKNLYYCTSPTRLSSAEAPSCSG